MSLKIHIVGLQKDALKAEIAERYPELQFVEEHPELILCYGGDGTLLYGERLFPGVPKALIRNSQVCYHCSQESKDAILQRLSSGTYTVHDYPKLQAEYGGKKLVALNDIMIGHARLNTSVRYQFFIHGKQYGKEMIGDGIVVSTPIGSTGYYQSITKSHFQDGFGIAFNNTINSVNHVVMHDLNECEVVITRGPAVVAADNNEELLDLSTGDHVKIRVTTDKAHIVEFDNGMAKFNVMTGRHRPTLGSCHICGKQYE